MLTYEFIRYEWKLCDFITRYASTFLYIFGVNRICLGLSLHVAFIIIILLQSVAKYKVSAVIDCSSIISIKFCWRKFFPLSSAISIILWLFCLKTDRWHANIWCFSVFWSTLDGIQGHTVHKSVMKCLKPSLRSSLTGLLKRMLPVSQGSWFFSGLPI